MRQIFGIGSSLELQPQPIVTPSHTFPGKWHRGVIVRLAQTFRSAVLPRKGVDPKVCATIMLNLRGRGGRRFTRKPSKLALRIIRNAQTAGADIWVRGSLCFRIDL